MNTKREDRAAAKLPRWANMTTSLRQRAVVLRQRRGAAIQQDRPVLPAARWRPDWTKINPDIFGSMIQAVAEDEERGELGCTTPVSPTS
jgi:hypothetical protein